ncbi:MAG: hypothetical protein FJZ86_01985 [Chloroflexi bacterium]|nr:hypothetical protein [Chloroflexota bacterium]
MKKNINKFISLSLFVFLVLSACNLGKAAPSATQAPVTEAAALPADTPTSAPTEAVIQHVLIPGDLPAEQSGLAGDHDSSTTADENRAPGGDRFTFGRYERPFNSEAMDVYYPYLDIQTTEFYLDDTWIYAVITLKGDESSQSLAGKYGFEIDLNVDGGGDWLIMAAQPSSTEWSTDGVQVWFDENDDVGGIVKVIADEVLPGGNGYETLIFGNGQEDDPDLAWVRVSPADSNTVQIVAKLSILEGDKTFMVGMWAGGEDFSPALFDVNDTLTHEQAGASLKELEFFYPIKELSELDNACRMAIGFQPSGNEPGLCPLPPGPPGEDPLPPSSCPPQYLFCYYDNYRNLVCVCRQP